MAKEAPESVNFISGSDRRCKFSPLYSGLHQFTGRFSSVHAEVVSVGTNPSKRQDTVIPRKAIIVAKEGNLLLSCVTILCITRITESERPRGTAAFPQARTYGLTLQRSVTGEFIIINFIPPHPTPLTISPSDPSKLPCACTGVSSRCTCTRRLHRIW